MALDKKRFQKELDTATEAIKTMKSNIEVLEKGILVTEVVKKAFQAELATFK